MKISAYNNHNNPSFKSLMTNKLILNGLEHIADHGTTFVAATSFIMAAGVRPAAIALTPNVDKENKRYSAVNSAASGLIKFGFTEAIALPVENAIKNIDKTPEKYLKQETIKTLKNSASNLTSSKNYNIITQTLKLFPSFITAIPKSMLTIALIPVIMDLLFKDRETENNKKYEECDNFIKSKTPDVFNDVSSPNNTVTFKGKGTEFAAKGISEILNNKTVQNIVTKHNFNETNIARNMSIATDVLLTASFAFNTGRSKKIEKDRKNPLIYNSIFSTAISLLAGCAIDKAVQNNTKNFIDKFKAQNQGNPKLEKYIQGINILRPALIFAGIYYGILPVATTYLADKTDKFIKKKRNNEN